MKFLSCNLKDILLVHHSKSHNRFHYVQAARHDVVRAFPSVTKGRETCIFSYDKTCWNLNNTKHLEDKFVMNPIYTLWRIKVLNQMTGAQQIIGIL